MVRNAIEPIEVNEDNGRTNLANLNDVFVDPDGDQLVFRFTGDPEEFGMDLDEENVLFIHPAENYNLPNGADITITATDPEDASIDYQFVIVITPVNDMPYVVNEIDDFEFNEDCGYNMLVNLNQVFDDLDGDDLSFSFFDDLDELNMTLVAGSMLVINPEDNFNLPEGTDIIVSAEDPDGSIAEGAFNLTINAVNDAPFVSQEIDDVEINQGAGRVDIADLDDVFDDIDFEFEGDELSFSVSETPEEIGLNIDDENMLYFDPEEDYSNVDGIEIIVNATDQNEASVEENFILRIIPIGGERELTVAFNEGWNIISINILPSDENLWTREEGPNVILMTEQLDGEEAHHIILFKDILGRFYLPAYGYTNIPYWNIEHGYLVKVDEDIETVWSGEPVDPDADITLTEGWNMIAYFPTYQLDASSPDFYVLSPIIDHVIIAKDVLGRVILPAWRYSNMEPWRETQGYQIKVDEDITLNYPEEQEDAAYEDFNNPDLTLYWTSLKSTGKNMSLLIDEFAGIQIKPGSQVGAFDSNGKLVGEGLISEGGKSGTAIWGDDILTEVKEGLLEGEAFSLRYWDTDTDSEFDLACSNVLAGKGLIYSTDEFSVVKVHKTVEPPKEYYLSNTYPNPFNSAARLNYGMVEDGRISIAVYDTKGQLIEVIFNGEQTAGHFQAVWNAKTVSSGVYLIQMDFEGRSIVRKAVVVR